VSRSPTTHVCGSYNFGLSSFFATHDVEVSRLENENATKNTQFVYRIMQLRPSLKEVELQATHIKSGICLSDEHLLTKAQKAIPFRHEVVMLSTRTL
jgi:hypothetical protein